MDKKIPIWLNGADSSGRALASINKIYTFARCFFCDMDKKYPSGLMERIQAVVL
jgi:hypothetical protein